MKLFVDDYRPCPAGWHLARTVTEAIRVLATMPVEVVSLDHDIAFQGRHGIELETFEGVAWYLAAMCVDERPRLVVIHTGNPTAASRMAGILEMAGILIEIRPANVPLEAPADLVDGRDRDI